MIRAVLNGELDDVPYETDHVFNLDVPQAVPGVPPHVLKPRSTWSDPVAYDTQARKLARMFNENFKSFEGEAAADVKAAGPR